MKNPTITRLLTLFILVLFVGGCQTNNQTESLQEEETSQSKEELKPGPITLVIHGGAGTILKKNMSPEREAEYRAKLEESLNTGYEVLKKGGTSVEAVIATLQVMEESPLFNAGVGAVFTNEGVNELDAAIMDGASGMAGAVAGVRTIKSPIEAAYQVMTNSKHVMMSGKGAEDFAASRGLEVVDNSYFYTERRYNSLQKAKEREADEASAMLPYQDWKYGTVGAAALDQDGNIASGTTTGGMTNKRFGRIGDAPIIGAGTYAHNESCAISATGHGEFFIRNVVGYDIAALMKYKGMSITEAADEVVMKKLVEKGGSGGVIGLDRQGNVMMTFNSEGMYRGFIKEEGKPQTFIYKDE
ncbi:MAG: isoaspartyl peptidase/L-asparaginase [Bacteroidota bacterium]